MQLHQIRYFLALSESLNFTRAAKSCNVSQPALARAIKMLEAELGGSLFRREGKSTHMTTLGGQILPVLKDVYAGTEAAKSQAAALRAFLNVATSKRDNCYY